MVYSKSPPDIAGLKTSLSSLGDFFHSLSNLPIAGYGKIIYQSQSRRIEGEDKNINDYYQKISNRFDEDLETIKILNESGLLSSEETNKIKNIALELTLLTDKPILVHGYYHTGNFFINEENKIIALDWDMACATHPAELLSGLYNCYVRQPLYGVSKEDSEECFSILAKNFLNNQNMPECTMNNMFKFIIIKDFLALAPMAKNLTVEREKATNLANNIRELISKLN